jgi:hypothetical protein
MANPEIQIQKSYRRNPETNAFLLEVDLNRYEDIFNEWDPAPFKRRDLDPDLRTYLESCSNDINLKRDIELLFSVPEDGEDLEKENHVREGLKNFFYNEKNLVIRERRHSFRRELFTAAAALILLILMVQVSRYELADLGLNVLREGLTIGAWVFTWEFTLSFFFRRTEMTRRRQKWQRFSRAKIRFCHGKDTEVNTDECI